MCSAQRSSSASVFAAKASASSCSTVCWGPGVVARPVPHRLAARSRAVVPPIQAAAAQRIQAVVVGRLPVAAPPPILVAAVPLTQDVDVRVGADVGTDAETVAGTDAAIGGAA